MDLFFYLQVLPRKLITFTRGNNGDAVVKTMLSMKVLESV